MPAPALNLEIGARNRTAAAFNRVEQSARGLGGRLSGAFRVATAAAVALAGAAVGITRQFSMVVDDLDELAKSARALELSPAVLQSYQRLGAIGGTTERDLTTAFRTLSGAQFDAAAGLQTYQRAFEALGVSYEDAGSLDQLFTDVVVALQNAEDRTAAVALANDLLGRSGFRVAAAFRTEAGTVDALQQAIAQRLDPALDGQAARAEQVKDSFTELGDEWTDTVRVLLDTQGPVGNFFQNLAELARRELMIFQNTFGPESLGSLNERYQAASTEYQQLISELGRLQRELATGDIDAQGRRRLILIRDEINTANERVAALREEITERGRNQRALDEETAAKQAQAAADMESLAASRLRAMEEMQRLEAEMELAMQREAAAQAFTALQVSQRTQVEAANAAYEEGRAIIAAYLETITGESPEAEEAIRRLGVSLTEALAFPAGDFLGDMDMDADDLLPDQTDLEDFYDRLARGTAGAFQRGITEGGRAGVDALLQLLTQLLTPLLEDLFSNLGGGEGGGTGSFLGNLFGGGRQFGGPTFPGRTYLVGERGPELFSPRVPGEIIPGADTGQTISISQTLIGNVDLPVRRAMQRQANQQADIIRSVDRERRLIGVS